MEKQIAVCIGTDRTQRVRVRLSLMIVVDGKVQSEHYHSINIEPGANLAELRAVNETAIAGVNNGIPFAPWPKIPDAEWARVGAVCSIFHTPEVVEAWKLATGVA